MLFDTPVYILFLSLLTLLYWRLNRTRQNLLLLTASYFFYGWWDWRFLGLILISTLVDYYCALAITASDQPARRKWLLTLSVTLNLGFLGYFKYCDFFVQSLADSLNWLGISVSVSLLNILLPPGISFYTFQALAYIVDVYQRKMEPAKSLVDYALFISLFPHLIAGPIQRPSHLLPQVQHPRVFDTSRMFDGVMLILSGLFRKAVIADNCALIANAAFSGKLGEPNLVLVAIGTYAFAWQIYGDFSGYSDMARGSAQLLGFHFMVNFRQPYLSRSIQEFWRRWHISLSTWLRDYLYIPLGGSRQGEFKTRRNLMLTMVLGGLWHGANSTFVIWGAIHGCWLAVERVFPSILGGSATAAGGFWQVSGWLRRVLIFHLVCLAWIFFRAPSMSEAFRFLGGLNRWEWRPEYGVAIQYLALFALPLLFLDIVLETRDEEYPFERTPVTYRILAATALVIGTTLFAANQVSAFIYFQF